MVGVAANSTYKQFLLQAMSIRNTIDAMKLQESPNMDDQLY